MQSTSSQSVPLTPHQKLEISKLVSLTRQLRLITGANLKCLRQEFEKTKYGLFPIDGSVCYICASWANHRHHVVPLMCGGSNEASNIVFLCRRCHRIIHPWIKTEKTGRLRAKTYKKTASSVAHDPATSLHIEAETLISVHSSNRQVSHIVRDIAALCARERRATNKDRRHRLRLLCGQLIRVTEFLSRG